MPLCVQTGLPRADKNLGSEGNSATRFWLSLAWLGGLNRQGIVVANVASVLHWVFQHQTIFWIRKSSVLPIMIRCIVRGQSSNLPIIFSFFFSTHPHTTQSRHFSPQVTVKEVLLVHNLYCAKYVCFFCSYRGVLSVSSFSSSRVRFAGSAPRILGVLHRLWRLVHLSPCLSHNMDSTCIPSRFQWAPRLARVAEFKLGW